MKLSSKFLIVFVNILISTITFSQTSNVVSDLKNASQAMSAIYGLQKSADIKYVIRNNVFNPEFYSSIQNDANFDVYIGSEMTAKQVMIYKISYSTNLKQLELREIEYADATGVPDLQLSKFFPDTQYFYHNDNPVSRLLFGKKIKRAFENIKVDLAKNSQNTSIEKIYEDEYNVAKDKMAKITENVSLNIEKLKALDLGDELCFMYGYYKDDQLLSNNDAHIWFSGFIENTNSDKSVLQLRISYINEYVNDAFDEWKKNYLRGMKKGDIIWVKPLADYKMKWYFYGRGEGFGTTYLRKCNN